MIGTLNTQDKRVTIIGAGISGLLIGYALKKKGYQITIHEKSDRCGGLIQTKHTPHGIVETAAHSLLVNESVQSFIDELGVELVPVNPQSKARYIYRRGKMRRMPLTFLEIFSTLFHFFRKPKLSKSFHDLTLEEWGNTYLGSAATRYLLAPFTAGIFACHPRELNTQISFPKLLPVSEKTSLFQHLKSLRKKSNAKRAQMMVFKNGTEDLVHQLQESLKDHIQFNSTISDFDSIDGNLILSIPSPDLEYSPLVTVTAFISKSAFLHQEPKGVGVLIPRGEGLRMLGCLFNSSAFPGRTSFENEVSLTLMYGGTSDPSALSLSDEALRALIQEELTLLLEIQEPPSHLEITRWQRAIPIYSSRLRDRMNEWSQNFTSSPGKIIFTNFSGQVSIRGMIEEIQKL